MVHRGKMAVGTGVPLLPVHDECKKHYDYLYIWNQWVEHRSTPTRTWLPPRLVRHYVQDPVKMPCNVGFSHPEKEISAREGMRASGQNGKNT